MINDQIDHAETEAFEQSAKRMAELPQRLRDASQEVRPRDATLKVIRNG